MRVLVLSHRDVLAALPAAACAEAMAEVLAAQARGEAYVPLRSMMIPPDAAGFMGLMPGWRGAHDGQAAAFGLKAVCIMPGNPARGLDAHQGIVTLFDGQTGQPTAILDASAITERRTAAVTAVATLALARRDARVLAILGAGTQARAHLEALAPVRPWEHVRVYSPTAAHARRLADEADGATVAGSAQEAVAGADVVVTATSSREPVLRRGWLAEGTHVNAVGASSPNARELDTATVAASALFCDSRESLRNEAGEFQLAIAEGLISGEEHVRAELGEVLAGTAAGRVDDAELTVFRSLGLAVEDLAAAQSAVAAAAEQGLGTEIEL
ncbi:MAG TPA: ornithine cyclodeaminase family protein [Streptosporangiaceae bacterium]|nr:ornithine cyclodeaminase family protein [Streptosporangiaceae bacterium]